MKLKHPPVFLRQYVPPSFAYVTVTSLRTTCRDESCEGELSFKKLVIGDYFGMGDFTRYAVPTYYDGSIENQCTPPLATCLICGYHGSIPLQLWIELIESHIVERERLLASESA